MYNDMLNAFARGANIMATEQALCALMSIKHMESGKPHLYAEKIKAENSSKNKFESIATSVCAMLKRVGIL